MSELPLSFFSLISVVVLAVVYYFLITEKINKVLVAVLGAVFLVVMQVFKTASHSSQENAASFISHNLDILGFVVGMMILVGIVRESGAFEAVAIWLVKKVKGNPHYLLISLGYLTLFMTAFLSNIPTVLIIVPVVLVLVRALNLPYLPYIFTVVVMANLGGAMTPISDPTTYYQAKTVGLSFAEVVNNSGLIVLILSVVSLAYILFIFREQLAKVKVSAKDVELFKPSAALRNKKLLYKGMPILIGVILMMVFKEQIFKATGILLENATLTIGGSFLAMLIFHRNPKVIFAELIDWEILFFFMGLFVVVGALEFTEVIVLLADGLVKVSGGSISILTLIMATGSAVLSTFIDNVPYNITMVGAIQSMEKGLAAAGISVYPLWWALNLGTSIGGAGSPIAAACNVIIFGQAEKEKYHTPFFKYLVMAMPLVLVNSLITFVIIWLRYLQ